MFINGREVNNPAARRIAAPFVFLIAFAVIGLFLLLLLPLLGIVIGGAIGVIGVGAAAALFRSARRRRRNLPKKEEFAEYRIIEQDEEDTRHLPE